MLPPQGNPSCHLAPYYRTPPPLYSLLRQNGCLSAHCWRLSLSGVAGGGVAVLAQRVVQTVFAADIEGRDGHGTGGVFCRCIRVNFRISRLLCRQVQSRQSPTGAAHERSPTWCLPLRLRTHPQLTAIARGEKLPAVRSLIYCTEDSVAARDLPQALANLAVTPEDCPRHRFIRLRDAGVMRQVLAMPHIARIHGFVLPKITAATLGDYRALLDTDFRLMPTLETQEIYREGEILRLLDVFERDGWRAHPLPAHQRQRPVERTAPAPPTRCYPLRHPALHPD